MRIIGGMYKKKKLLSVPGMDTRPTADRLRETLFNILSYDVREAVVLDLFAGTGALGLEALSRGAASCVFIDNSRDALSVIQKNCDACAAMTARTNVVRWDITRNLNCIKNAQPPFSLVFADPPYGKNLIPPTFESLANANCLADGARIVVEHGVADGLPAPPCGFSLDETRTYGRTALTFFVYSHSVFTVVP